MEQSIRRLWYNFPEVEIISIITKKSAKGLTLSKGKEVYAVIKASNVMIATD
jgi:molybdopterin-binding protein